MANYAELGQKYTGLNSQLTELNTRIEMSSQQLKKMEAEMADREQAVELIHLFEAARDVLHRNKLPKLAMQHMLFGLNNLLDKWLSMFNTEFTSYINEDLDFVCDFEDGKGQPAGLLSGGQKVALSISFRLALSELFGSSVPLLVMDEPTIWLDEDKVNMVAQVLETLRGTAEQGVCMLVGTHEEALRRGFTATERIE